MKLLPIEIIILYHKVREWKTKYQLKDEIQDFLPLYEIPIKTMIRLELRYQLKAKSIETKLKLKLIINKICALRYRNIVSTTKTHICMKRLDTNRN